MTSKQDDGESLFVPAEISEGEDEADNEESQAESMASDDEARNGPAGDIEGGTLGKPDMEETESLDSSDEEIEMEDGSINETVLKHLRSTMLPSDLTSKCGEYIKGHGQDLISC